MKWSNLFSRKRAGADDVAFVEPHTGLRFMPYALVIAVALLVAGFYQQPMAQDDEESPSAPPAVVVAEEDEDVTVAEDVAAEEVAQETPPMLENEQTPVTQESENVTTPEVAEITTPEVTTPDVTTPDDATMPDFSAMLTSELPDNGVVPPVGEIAIGEDSKTATPTFTTPEATDDASAIMQPLVGQYPAVELETGPVTTRPAGEDEEEQIEIVTTEQTNWTAILISVAIFLLILGGSSFLANAAAKAWRMPEHSFKFFLVLFTSIGSITATCLSLSNEQLTLGIDLSGGVVLVYDVKAHSDSDDGKPSDSVVSQQEFDDLVKSVNNRINPASIKEIDVRKYGTSQLKIVIPKADSAEVNRIVKIISEAGTLEFRILASQSLTEDQAIIRQAESRPDQHNVYENGVLVAKWVPINKEEMSQFLNSPVHVVRLTGETWEVLVLKDMFDVKGEHLRNIHQGMFPTGRRSGGVMRPGVAFELNSAGTTLFTGLTSRYALGEGAQYTRFLGIIMSGEMYSAPTLEEPITGGGCHITFSPRPGDENNEKLQKDIKDLLQVMRAGALPADISKEPISRNEMGPTLGDTTIRYAKISAMIAGLGIFLFMVFYYRICGFIACLAVVMNLFLVMTVMLSIRAAFTLAGLAGLVLTFGMAVDANILIFERLREELNAGSTLRHAIRNAYARASTAIIDSNLTTLFVAIILYSVGTEQTKGFAVTLFLGVIFTMYTAVFCSHVVFEVLERRGWLKRVTMMQIVNKPNIDFMALRKTTVTIFGVLCVLSLALVFIRGWSMCDIDFNGGVSVDIAFKKDATATDGDITTQLMSAGIEKPTVSKVYETITDTTQVEFAKQIGQRFTISSATPVGMEANDYLKLIRATIAELYKDQLIFDTIHFTPLEERQGVTAMEVVTHIKVNPSMNYMSLDDKLKTYSAQQVDEKVIVDTLNYRIVCDDDPDAEKSSKSHSNWTVTFFNPKDDVQKVLDVFKAEFDAAPWFPASNEVGRIVAGYAMVASLAAIFASFVAMVLYLWLRFFKVYFGLAAVVTLINNILITLGALAVSVWLKPALAFALVDDFKIGLTVIAAFLTIIGYSINDTIILFDRIREVRGKSSQLTIEHINQSVNQVLSRTVLTSFSTLYVIIVLYFTAGPGLRTFAYALGAGIIVGTLASIFLAAPLLYWMVNEPGKTKAVKSTGNVKVVGGKHDKKGKGKYDRKP